MAGPSIEFDWELGVFQTLRRMYRSVVPEQERFTAGCAAFVAQHQQRLAVVASVVAGRTLSIEVSRGDGGIRDDVIVLPEAVEVSDDPEVNYGVLLIRVLMDAQRLGQVGGRVSTRDAMVGAARARNQLCVDFPRFAEAWGAAVRLVQIEDQPWVRAVCLGEPLPAGQPPRGGCLLWGRFLVTEGRVDDVAGDLAPSNAEGSEHDAAAPEDIHVHTLGEEDVRQLPIHSFEKVELVEAFNGNLRQLDGDDELDDHLEALQEIDMSHLIRGGPDAGAVYRAEVGLNAAIPDVHSVEPDERAIPYPEWDQQRCQYRPNWCQVYDTPLPRWTSTGLAARRLAEHQGLVDRLVAQLTARRTERRIRTRQLDGSDIDLGAAVMARADQRAGNTPSPRLYERAVRDHRDVATTVLLDLSLSSDSWVDGQRVLEVCRDAVWVLGEVAQRCGDSLQVLGFASHTRNRVRVYRIRDWHEPWSVGAARLEHVEPVGYTRIGPAIRHATEQLVSFGARKRVLLLISDGKPTDFDRYEGRHGVADVRQALRDARRTGIHTHGLAVDPVARRSLPTMFGPGGWTVLRHPEDLSGALGSVYLRSST